MQVRKRVGYRKSDKSCMVYQHFVHEACDKWVGGGCKRPLRILESWRIKEL